MDSDIDLDVGIEFNEEATRDSYHHPTNDGDGDATTDEPGGFQELSIKMKLHQNFTKTEGNNLKVAWNGADFLGNGGN